MCKFDHHSLDKRKAEAERIRQKYQDRIPVSLTTVKAGRLSRGVRADPLFSLPRLDALIRWDVCYFAPVARRNHRRSRRLCRAQVICEKTKGSDIAEIDKKKYLVPSVSVQLPNRLLLPR